MIAALSEMRGERNASSRSRNESTDDAGDEERHAVLHVLALVLERGGDPADLER